MSEQTFTAILSQSSTSGHWRLFVALLNTTDPWPEHDFARPHPLPVPAERTAALARLGYTPATDARWEWSEDTAPNGPTALFATLTVRDTLTGEAL